MTDLSEILLEEIRKLTEDNKKLRERIEELSNPTPSPMALSTIQELPSREEKKSKVNLDKTVDYILAYAKAGNFI